MWIIRHDRTYGARCGFTNSASSGCRDGAPSMMLANLYDALNHLFGTPTNVSSESYTRTETLFREQGIPMLNEIITYLSPTSHVLIVGCGSGVEVEWFAQRCGSVTAVDISQIALDKAAEQNKNYTNIEFVLVNARELPFPTNEFDLIFMRNVSEHIINMQECFDDYFRVLKPGKIMVNWFAPLFYSPYGAHLQDALKMPWGHLIFGPRAVVEVRNRYYPGHSNATNWEDLGLNRITEHQYRKIVNNAGFITKKYAIRTSKNLPLVSHIPLIRNLFILGIEHIMSKPPISEKVQ
jgi:SAM-dependent methyltransferase